MDNTDASINIVANVRARSRNRNGTIIEEIQGHNRISYYALGKIIDYISGYFNTLTEETLTNIPQIIAIGRDGTTESYNDVTGVRSAILDPVTELPIQFNINTGGGSTIQSVLSGSVSSASSRSVSFAALSDSTTFSNFGVTSGGYVEDPLNPGSSLKIKELALLDGTGKSWGRISLTNPSIDPSSPYSTETRSANGLQIKYMNVADIVWNITLVSLRSQRVYNP